MQMIILNTMIVWKKILFNKKLNKCNQCLLIHKTKNSNNQESETEKEELL